MEKDCAARVNARLHREMSSAKGQPKKKDRGNFKCYWRVWSNGQRSNFWEELCVSEKWVVFLVGAVEAGSFQNDSDSDFSKFRAPTPASGDLANPTTKRLRFRQQLQLSYKIVEKLATNNPVDESFRLMIFVRLLLRLQPDSSSDSTALYLISNKWSMYI